MKVLYQGKSAEELCDLFLADKIPFDYFIIGLAAINGVDLAKTLSDLSQSH